MPPRRRVVPCAQLCISFCAVLCVTHCQSTHAEPQALTAYPGCSLRGPSLQRVRLGSFVLDKGTDVYISVALPNYDARIWGPDVNEFKPERFAGNALLMETPLALCLLSTCFEADV